MTRRDLQKELMKRQKSSKSRVHAGDIWEILCDIEDISSKDLQALFKLIERVRKRHARNN